MSIIGKIFFKFPFFTGPGGQSPFGRNHTGRPRVSVFATKAEKDKKDSPTGEVYGKTELEEEGDSSSGPDDPQDMGSDMDEAFIGGHRGELIKKLNH